MVGIRIFRLRGLTVSGFRNWRPCPHFALIGTIRREYLDHMLFWTSADLENKLLNFSGTTSTTIAPNTHGKGERRICQCHHP